ncbi:tyrosine phosphatase family-domain-containing protein [Gongronella butleri]|nr:tyrosine phosphatase family-domain-containing protein [Gongronella butleri]
MVPTSPGSLIPPFRFALVDEDLYRGGYPKPRNYKFLKNLRLKTILSLIPDTAVDELQQFCKEEKIHMLRLKVDRMKEDNITLTYNKTLLALHIIIDPENHPIYIHCLDGANVTGLVIACLRRLQRWHLKSAMLEFSRHLHTNVVSSEEYEFVENFRNFEISIPLNIPLWLHGCLQPSHRKHPCLRLTLLNPELVHEKAEEKRAEHQKWKNDNLFDANAPPASHHHHHGHHRSGSNITGNEETRVMGKNAATDPTDDSSHQEEDTHDSDDHQHEPHPEQSKDQYMVDVEMDDVMMDGLDQVPYFHRHDADKDQDQDAFWTEPFDGAISRTLEALALEGLD